MLVKAASLLFLQVKWWTNLFHWIPQPDRQWSPREVGPMEKILGVMGEECVNRTNVFPQSYFTVSNNSQVRDHL